MRIFLKKLPSIKWSKISSVCLSIISFMLFFIIGVKYILPLLTPFIVGFIIAMIINPIAKYFCLNTKIPTKVIRVVLLLIAILLICTFAFLAVNRLIVEVQRILTSIANGSGFYHKIIIDMSAFIRLTMEKFSIISRYTPGSDSDLFLQNLEQISSKVLQENMNTFGEKIGVMISTTIEKLPMLIISVLISIVTAFYFGIDYERITTMPKFFLSDNALEKLEYTKEKIVTTVVKYCRAYFFLFLITFVEVFIGLLILEPRYAFLIAIICACIDILPVLGTGVVLFPWSIMAIVRGNLKTGIGLIILYILIIVVRQLVEPRIIGKSTGIHPLFVLLAMYVGIKTIGVIGVFLLPLSMIITYNIIADRSQKT